LVIREKIGKKRKEKKREREKKINGKERQVAGLNRLNMVSLLNVS